MSHLLDEKSKCVRIKIILFFKLYSNKTNVANRTTPSFHQTFGVSSLNNIELTKYISSDVELLSPQKQLSSIS